jgi:hypothetical protein
MEASMHGSLDNKSPQADQSIYRSWNIKLIALPVLLAIALIGYAVSHPDVSKWVSDAVQAEFVGTDLVPNLATPPQVAQPSNQIRTVLAH